MKGKGTGTSNLALWIILLVFCGVSVAVVMNKRGAGQPPFPTTYSAHKRGLKALYLLLAESGYNVHRQRRGFASIPDEAAALVIVDPVYPVGGPDVAALKEWVKNGGTLVTDMNCTDGVPAALDFGVSCGIGAFGEKFAVKEKAGIVRGINEIGPMFSPGASDFPAETIPLVYRKGRAIIAVAQLGEGRVIAGPFETLFLNENISKMDNPRLAFNIFDLIGKDAPVYFDEFHHGYTDAGEKPMYTLRDAVFSSPYGLFTLQILLACILLFLNRNGVKILRRNGRRSLSASPLEFVNAGAKLYSRAGAHTRSAAAMLRIFNGELNRALGLPHDAPYEQAARMFKPGAETAENLLALARLHSDTLAGRRITAAEALEAAQIIDELEREVVKDRVRGAGCGEKIKGETRNSP